MKNMEKKKNTSRDSLFLLIGFFVYSFIFWITAKNHAHGFGIILTGLICNILYKFDHKMPADKEWIKTKDIIYMCVGAILSSLMEGFPFNYLPPYSN